MAGRGGGASRAGPNVTISGLVVGDDTGLPAPTTWSLLLWASNFSVAEVQTTLDGTFNFTAADQTDWYVACYALEVVLLPDGYGGWGHIPQWYAARTNGSDVVLAPRLIPAFNILLEAWDPTGTPLNDSGISPQRFLTAGDEVAAYGVGVGISNGTVQSLSMLVPGDARRDLYLPFTVPGFGNVMVWANNSDQGWQGAAKSGVALNLNYEIARTQVARFRASYDRYAALGYPASAGVNASLFEAESSLAEASLLGGAARAAAADAATNASLWGIEGLELGRAGVDIDRYRRGDLSVHVVDRNGIPVPGATVSVDQTDHQFRFGVFEPVSQVGRPTYLALKDAGVNAVTIGFYWIGSEPTDDGYDWSTFDTQWDEPWLVQQGFHLRGHALMYLLPPVLPDYVKALSYDELRVEVDEHVQAIVSRYGADFELFEVSNEMAGSGGMLGYSRDQVDGLMNVSAAAIAAAAPDTPTTINNANYWYAEFRASSFIFGPDADAASQSIVQFHDHAAAVGLDYDWVSQQMYDGGASSFFMDFGLADDFGYATTYDLGHVATTLRRLGGYGKPLRISEESVSGTWNASWDPAQVGWWHHPWDEATQAEFVRSFYTIAFGERSMQEVTWWDVDDQDPFMEAGGWFHKDLTPKPAFTAFKDLVANWTTHDSGMTASDGARSFRPFGGSYTVSATLGTLSNTTSIVVPEQAPTDLTLVLDGLDRRPNLEIASVTLAPTPLVVGGADAQVAVAVRNAGETPAAAATMEADLFDTPHGGALLATLTTTTPLLGPWEESVVNLSVALPSQAGSYALGLLVDSGDAVDERDEEDNVGNATLQVASRPPGTITVTVTDDLSGDGVLALIALRPAGPAEDPPRASRAARAGADGSFRFEDVEPGDWELTAGDDTANGTIGYVPVSWVVRLESAEDRTLGGPLARRTVLLQVAVVDALSKGRIAGAVIEASCSGTTAGGTTGGPSLVASVAVPWPGCTVGAAAPGYAPKDAAVTIAPPTADGTTMDVTIALPRTTGIIDVLVRHATDGTAVAGATITITHAETNRTVTTDTTSPEGTLEADLLAPGRYVVGADAPGFLPTSLQVQVVANGRTGANLTLAAGIGSTVVDITIRVLGVGDDRPVVGATVRVATLPAVTTGVDGNTTVRGVTPGPVSVDVAAEGYQEAGLTLHVEAQPPQGQAFTVRLERAPGPGDGGRRSDPAASWIPAVMAVVILALAAILLLVARRRLGPKGGSGTPGSGGDPAADSVDSPRSAQ